MLLTASMNAQCGENKSKFRWKKVSVRWAEEWVLAPKRVNKWKSPMGIKLLNKRKCVHAPSGKAERRCKMLKMFVASVNASAFTVGESIAKFHSAIRCISMLSHHAQLMHQTISFYFYFSLIEHSRMNRHKRLQGRNHERNSHLKRMNVRKWVRRMHAAFDWFTSSEMKRIQANREWGTLRSFLRLAFKYLAGVDFTCENRKSKRWPNRKTKSSVANCDDWEHSNEFVKLNCSRFSLFQLVHIVLAWSIESSTFCPVRRLQSHFISKRKIVVWNRNNWQLVELGADVNERMRYRVRLQFNWRFQSNVFECERKYLFNFICRQNTISNDH